MGIDGIVYVVGDHKVYAAGKLYWCSTFGGIATSGVNPAIGAPIPFDSVVSIGSIDEKSITGRLD